MSASVTSKALVCLSLLAAAATAVFFVAPNSRFVEPADLDLRSANAMAEEWFLSQLDSSGVFIYAYDDEGNLVSGDNNAIRQLMASRLLADLASDRQELIPLHERNIRSVLLDWYREDGGIGYVEYDGASTLGANAMALRTILASPFYPQLLTKAEALVRGLLALVDSAGSFRAWYKGGGGSQEYEDYLLTFYSGEALLALIDFASRTSDRSVLAAAISVQDYYLERYVEQLTKHYYPSYVPWHTMSLAALFRQTRDLRYAAAIFALNDTLLSLLDTTQRHGRFYNVNFPQYGAPHSSSDGIYSEGLAYAYVTASETGDTGRCRKYKRALGLAVGNLLSLQIRDDEGAPSHLAGAIRTSHGRFASRIDNTQHALDAIRYILANGGIGNCRTCLPTSGERRC